MTANIERIIGQASRVPIAEELRAARVAFERIAPRDVFYRAARELVESALMGRSSLSVAEAIAVLLQDWNRSFYRYRPFDEQHFLELEALLDSFCEPLAGYERRDIESLTGQDEAPVKEVFAAFEALLGPVGAAKCLHLLGPRFFPLWDRAIAAGYGLSLGRMGQNAKRYWLFMQITKEQVRRLRGAFAGDNLLKILDEYNYCVYTRHLQLLGPT